MAKRGGRRISAAANRRKRGRPKTPEFSLPVPFPAGLTVPDVERLSPHGLRAGFVTEAYAAGARDEQIMAHTRHRDLKTMRGYVRRARLGLDSPAKLLGL